MPTIRIDDDVYSWLKSQAIPFEDTPNSVLRRLAGLDIDKRTALKQNLRRKEDNRMAVTADSKGRPITGKYLRELWNVDVVHALYHQDGTWFENLQEFPGALFDRNGYILFKTEEEYKNSPYLSIGEKLNVHNGISSIPGYKRMR